MNREEKIKYLQDVRDGKQPKDEFLYNLLTLQELNTLHDLLKIYGGTISEDIISPEDKSTVEAIEKKYNERVTALTKEEFSLIKKDHKYFTIGEEAIKVQQIRKKLQII